MTKITLDSSISGVYYNGTLVKGVYYNGTLVYSAEGEYTITLLDEIYYEVMKLTTVNGKLEYLPKLPNQTGKRFDGWYSSYYGGVEITTDTVFTEDTNIYSRYMTVYEEYTITLVDSLNNEQWIMKTKGNQLETLPVLSKQGYEFLGWKYKEGPDQYTVTTDTVFTKNVTVYASWVKLAEFKLTFNPRTDEHNVYISETVGGKAVYYPTTLENISSNPEDSYYSDLEDYDEFALYGWFYYDKENDIVTQLNESSEFTEDTELWAKWFPVYYDEDYEKENPLEFDLITMGLNDLDDFFYDNYSYFNDSVEFRHFIISYNGNKIQAVNPQISDFPFYLTCNTGETWRDFADSCRTVTESGGHSQYITYHPIGAFPAGESPFGDVSRLVCFRINESDEIELFLMENDLYEEEVIATDWASPDDVIGWNTYDL